MGVSRRSQSPVLEMPGVGAQRRPSPALATSHRPGLDRLGIVVQALNPRRPGLERGGGGGPMSSATAFHIVCATTGGLALWRAILSVEELPAALEPAV